jgi:CPA2 family monovalent cation:H+ antiporter-2
VPLLIVLPQIGEIGTEGSGMRVTRATLAAGLFLLVVITVGARVLPALLRRVVRWGSRELFLIAIVAAGVGIGYLAFRMGLSFAIGAFVAGLILSESEMSHQALSDIGPLRDLFGLLFFVSVGMLFDPRFALAHAGEVAAIVLATIVGKSLICATLARAFGYKNLAPWIVGLGLSQVGEFSFVLARVGQAGGFISDDTYNLALTCTVLSMASSPLVFPGLLPVARAWARSRQKPTSPTTTHVSPVALENHVIVAGYGRTGRAVVGALHGAGVPYVVVEHHHEALTALSEQGIPTVWGDIAGEDILRAAGVAQARMIVMAVPEWRAVRLGIEHATRLNARLFVVARATTTAHVEDLRGLRVDAIVQPEFEGGVEMVRRALRQLDRQDDEIDRLSSDLRRALYGDHASDNRPGG